MTSRKRRSTAAAIAGLAWVEYSWISSRSVSACRENTSFISGEIWQMRLRPRFGRALSPASWMPLPHRGSATHRGSRRSRGLAVRSRSWFHRHEFILCVSGQDSPEQAGPFRGGHAADYMPWAVGKLCAPAPSRTQTCAARARRPTQLRRRSHGSPAIRRNAGNQAASSVRPLTPILANHPAQVGLTVLVRCQPCPDLGDDSPNDPETAKRASRQRHHRHP